MSKFSSLILDELIGRFEAGMIPDSADFEFLMRAIKNGIEYHEHSSGGGPDSCTGDAAPVVGAEANLDDFYVRYALGIRYTGG